MIRRLPSGLGVVLAPLPHLHTATVAVFVQVGSRHETPKDNGIGHFLEHVVFRGTERHPTSYALNLAVEELGGVLDGETHADMTVYHATVPPEHAGEAVRILGDMMTAPLLRDLDVERAVVREELLEDLDEDGLDVNPDNASRRLLFAPHPLGLPIPGTVSNLARFDAQALRAHMRRHYVAPNVTVVATGAIDTARIEDAIASAFDAIPGGTPTACEPPRDATRERFLFIDDSGSQSHVRMSFRTFGETDARSAALHLLARILDDGLASRVPRRISDEAGLAYDAFAALETWSDAGALDFGAQVAHGKAAQVITAFAELVAELRRDGVGDDELARAKRRWRFQLEAMADDGVGTAFFHGTAAVTGREGEDPRALADRAAAVTAGDVHEVARTLLAPDRLHAVCIGDATAGRRARRAFTQLGDGG